jgi:F-type H+-transporting ATPase subunit delta
LGSLARLALFLQHRTGERTDVANDGAQTEGMPGRYAGALFELAKEQGQGAEVEGALKGFEALLGESEDLRRFVRSPVISGEEQAKALSAILAKAGVGGLTANFLGLLAKNRRLFAVGDIIKAFMARAAAARGEVQAEVASALPLTDAQRAQLESVLKGQLGKDVRLAAKVDPHLLGGLVVKLGSRMIDNSVRTRLNGLRAALAGES